LEELVPDHSATRLESHLVDKDIRTYVHERLSTDKSFSRWQKDLVIQEEIEMTLGRKACGMYSHSLHRSDRAGTDNNW
jgi:hypothetical protein